jgi:hypothetical protein
MCLLICRTRLTASYCYVLLQLDCFEQLKVITVRSMCSVGISVYVVFFTFLLCFGFVHCSFVLPASALLLRLFELVNVSCICNVKNVTCITQSQMVKVTHKL